MVIKQIAVLLTCYNRKAKTLQCLQSFYKTLKDEEALFDIYLVDDGSTDGTSEEITKKFPNVNIIKGNGELYWNRGMLLAWETAKKTKDYDFYLWLNDDVIIKKQGLNTLIKDYATTPNSIICGAMQSQKSQQISYGGKDKNGNLIIPKSPNRTCTFINGNMVLVPKSIFDAVGLLDPIFPHAIGDYDYGLRAIKKGFKCFASSKYTGYCESNPTLPKWCLPQVKLKNRIKSLYSPLGNSHPYYYFIYEHRHFGLGIALKHYITIHLRLVFPKLWKQ
ncbi:glycosyltransferase family 2 protein [Algibacter lectus]|uniref:glycosyltransferase family 2 protein n=1 Tax=Algibacter lectus TaxID=221126 RepID=UPI002493F009|nr:glycosyltransferase family 2 protein [Algibacter lectus]